MGIEVRFVLGDMVVLNIPADKLLQLEQVKAFSYVAADEKLYPMNDKSRKAANVDQVVDKTLSQEVGLPQAFTGKSVVLGIVDQGFDYNHAAFRNDDGSTRIVKVIEYSFFKPQNKSPNFLKMDTEYRIQFCRRRYHL